VRLLALALAALALAAPAAASEEHPTPAELEGELVCPTCDQTLDQSNAPIAQRMKVYIRERIAAGDTKGEIKDKLVADFGPGVLATPAASGFGLLAWVLPLGGIVLGGLVLALLAWRWSRGRGDRPPGQQAPAPPLDPELERRLDDELARFE
jgi:cytochrome c-type biogenesis protein CcmH